MTRSPPSREYFAATSEHNYGPAWHTTNEDLADFAYSFFGFSGMLYKESLPKKRRNLIGNEFAYEFGFLSGIDFPNAYAFSDSSGRLFIGITASMYGLVNRVCDQMFADEAIENLLDEEMTVTERREMRLTAEFLDMSQKESIIFSNFLMDDEDPVTDLPANWREQFVAAGDFMFATSTKYRVRDAILSYIFHHEMGHLIEGHVGLLSHRYGAVAVRESDGITDETSQRLAMEFQADSSASKALALLASGRHTVARHMGIESSWNRIVTLDLLAIYVAHSILTMSAMASEQISKGRELSELDVRNIFHRSASYPSAGVRTVSSLNTYIRALEALDKNVDEVFDTGDRRFFKVLQIMKSLGDRYLEFAMMMGIVRVFEDDFHSERLGIARGASIKALATECAPYSFGGLV